LGSHDGHSDLLGILAGFLVDWIVGVGDKVLSDVGFLLNHDQIIRCNSSLGITGFVRLDLASENEVGVIYHLLWVYAFRLRRCRLLQKWNLGL